MDEASTAYGEPIKDPSSVTFGEPIKDPSSVTFGDPGSESAQQTSKQPELLAWEYASTEDIHKAIDDGRLNVVNHLIERAQAGTPFETMSDEARAKWADALKYERDKGVSVSGALKAAKDAAGPMAASMVRGAIALGKQGVKNAALPYRYAAGADVQQDVKNTAAMVEAGGMNTANLLHDAANKLQKWAGQTKGWTNEEWQAELNRELAWRHANEQVLKGGGALGQFVPGKETDPQEVADASIFADPTLAVPGVVGKKALDVASKALRVGALAEKPAAIAAQRIINKGALVAPTVAGKTAELAVKVPLKVAEKVTEGLAKKSILEGGAVGAIANIAMHSEPATGLVMGAVVPPAAKLANKVAKSLGSTLPAAAKGAAEDITRNVALPAAFSGAVGAGIGGLFAATAPTEEQAGSAVAGGALFGAGGGVAHGLGGAAGRKFSEVVQRTYQRPAVAYTPAFDVAKDTVGANPAGITTDHLAQWEAETKAWDERNAGSRPIDTNLVRFLRALLLKHAPSGVETKVFSVTPETFGKATGNESAAGIALTKSETYTDASGKQVNVVLLNNRYGARAALHETGHIVLDTLLKPEQKQQFLDLVDSKYSKEEKAAFKQSYENDLGSTPEAPITVTDDYIKHEMAAELLSNVLRGYDGKDTNPQVWKSAALIAGGVLEALGLHQPAIHQTPVVPGYNPAVPLPGGVSPLGIGPSFDIHQLGAKFLKEAGVKLPPEIARLKQTPEEVAKVNITSKTPPGAPLAPVIIPKVPGAPRNVEMKRARKAAQNEPPLFTLDPTDYDAWKQGEAVLRANGATDDVISKFQALRDNGGSPVDFMYESINKSGVATPNDARRVERALGYIAEELGKPVDEVRTAYLRQFVPSRVVLRWDVNPDTGARVPNVNVLGFSPGVVWGNAAAYVKALREKGLPVGNYFPFEVGADGRITDRGFQQLDETLKVYSQNQANGRRGDGQPLSIPRDYQPETPAANPAYTPVMLDENTANTLNLLIGLEPPTTSKKGARRRFDRAGNEITQPGNVAAQILATGNLKTPVESPFANKTIVKSGPNKGLPRDLFVPENMTVAETNPLRAEVGKQGINLSKLLGDAVQELNLENVRTPITPVVSEMKPVSSPVVEAGFMPGESDLTPASKPTNEYKYQKVWISPSGQVYPLEGLIHAQWANQTLGLAIDSAEGMDKLMQRGWIRTTPFGADTVLSQGLKGQGLTPKQEAVLKDIAIETGAKRWVHDTGNSYRVRWAPDAEMRAMPGLNQQVRDLADEYMKGAGLEFKPHTKYAPVREETAKKVADWYETAQHTPDDPKVKAAYQAFADETKAQWDFLTSKGVVMEPWTGKGEPYANSTAMTDDVRNNNHLYFLRTEGNFGSNVEMEHPLLADSGVEVNGYKLTYNDLFRAVHDYFGHAKEGYEFGPRGEYNAYLAHVAMFSPEARPAMAAETMGQNSWVNFGKHLRNAEGKVPGKGEAGFKPLAERPFAEQKATVLPDELLGDSTKRGLRPALLLDGKPVHYPGANTHADILSEVVKHGTMAEKLAAVKAFGDDTTHTFVDENGEVLDRTAAGKRFDELQGNPPGTTGALHSQEIPDSARLMPASKELPDELGPVWHSTMQRAIEAKMPNSVSPEQLLSTLRNSGVKPDEMKWTGLDDFLNGKKSVSKQEVLDYLKANQLELREVVKGGFTKIRMAQWYDVTSAELEARGGERWELADYSHSGAPYVVIHKDSAERVYDVYKRDGSFYGSATTLDEAQQRARILDDSRFYKNSDETKYENYQLPGGENYREILFSLPVKAVEDRFKVRLNDAETEHAGKPVYDVIDTQMGDRVRYTGHKAGASQWLDAAISNSQHVDYKSGHWDEPNVVAHTRINDREVVTPSGTEDMLFAEEFQSDWHREGKKHGYRDEKRKAEIQAMHDKWIEETGLTSFDWREEHPELVAESRRAGSLHSVADAPFKNSWYEMVFRRLVRMAAEEGKDWLGWTTGEQQADRYDLRKHISTLKATKTLQGKYAVSAENLDGAVVLNDVYSADKLPEVVGAELAKRIIADVERKTFTKDELDAQATRGKFKWVDNGEGKLASSGLFPDAMVATPNEDGTYSLRGTKANTATYTGLDLKTGGEGKNKLYDEMLVDYANKFGKKWGAKVEDVRTFGDQSYEFESYSQFTKRLGVTPRELAADRNYWVDRYNKEKQFVGSHQTVHALRITPEMKASVLKEGVAQFMPAPPVESEQFRGWFRSSKVVDPKGVPMRLYRGDNRDIGSKFDPNKSESTSGFYFTSDPEIASNYATSKRYIEDHSNYDEYFRVKPSGTRGPTRGLSRLWYDLTPEERQRVTEVMRNTGVDENTSDFRFNDPEGAPVQNTFDWELKQSNGNALKAGVEAWLSSGMLFGEEPRFLELLKEAGIDKKVTYDDPREARPAVTPVYLSVQNPLDVATMDQAVIDKITAAAKGLRGRTTRNIHDMRRGSADRWLKMLQAEFDKGEPMTDSVAFVAIPDAAMEAMKRAGYDGIHDWGGKHGGTRHDVWIAFEPEQIKSATGNRGTFDPSKKDIRFMPVQERLELVHFSRKYDLKVLDPKFQGTGLLGRESERRKAYPSIYQPRTYFYIKGAKKEGGLGDAIYTALVEREHFYDLSKDADDLMPSADDLRKAGYAPFDEQAADTLYEKRIKEAGYAGMIAPSDKVVAKFTKTPVTRVTDPSFIKKANAGKKLGAVPMKGDARLMPGDWKTADTADELFLGTGNAWLGRDGKFLTVPRHADERNAYEKGWLRVVKTRRFPGGDPLVWVNDADGTLANVTPKQRAAIETLKERGAIVENGHSGVRLMPGGKQSSLDLGLPETPTYNSAEISKLTIPQLRKRFPEAVVPRAADETLPSDIVGSPRYRKAADHKAAVESFAGELVDKFNKFADTHEAVAGQKWYSETTPMLHEYFGEDAQVFAELLAATSPETDPKQNFNDAWEAYQLFKAGTFDPLIAKYREGMDKLADGTLAGEYSKATGDAEPKEDYQLMNWWIKQHDLKPKKALRSRKGEEVQPNFHKNGTAVMKVLARQWLSQNRGLKTSQFVRNLLGLDHGATIDLWADRTMREAGYKGYTDRWRILPQHKQGVSDRDFNFSQEVFKAAADKLGLKPSELQGALWFIEKKLWAEQGWSRLDFGDYRPLVRNLIERRKAGNDPLGDIVLKPARQSSLEGLELFGNNHGPTEPAKPIENLDIRPVKKHIKVDVIPRAK